MFIRRSLLFASVLTAAVVAVPAPAHALLYPQMSFDPVVTLRDSRGKVVGYRLCAHGDASFLYVSGAWEFRMDGTRATAAGTPGPFIAERSAQSGYPRYNGCLTAYRLGHPTGHVHATFSYTGVGGDQSHAIEHTFTWCDGCPNPVIGLDLGDGVLLSIDPVE